MRKFLLGFCLAASLGFFGFSVQECRCQEYSLSTNLADYANLGTLNLEASYGVARKWSLVAALKYNPFSFDNQGVPAANKQRSLSAGVRYWPWHIYSGWWMSGAVRYQEYSVSGLSSEESTQGDRFGSSFGAGYSFMLTKYLNLELGAGFWAGYDMYMKYSCATCGRPIENGRKFFVYPSNILLGLSFVF
ncbi:MAG: DUF3575 domain-containing protein [Candidatus Cryptobacteroides sp.]|nr:DUF3575 domain-containing protein [Bacteroidales bacterium]